MHTALSNSSFVTLGFFYPTYNIFKTLGQVLFVVFNKTSSPSQYVWPVGCLLGLKEVCRKTTVFEMGGSEARVTCKRVPPALAAHSGNLPDVSHLASLDAPDELKIMVLEWS